MLSPSKMERATVLCCVLVLFLAMAVSANGGGTSAATPPPPVVTPPATPGGVGAAGSRMPAVGSVAQIEQRGNVVNLCEEQVMMQRLVSQMGGQATFGDYRVGYILNAPLGWYESKNGSLVWRVPAANETQHIEVVIMDSLTGKTIPMTDVTVEVLDQQGNRVDNRPMVFTWHPMADHYATNAAIPNAGTYTLRFRAPAPMIQRHHRELGQRFEAALDARFTGVQITPKTPPGPPLSQAETHVAQK